MENRTLPTLRNEKVVLRPLLPSDKELLWPVAQERELWTYGLKDLSLPGELGIYIGSAIDDMQAGNAFVWVIIDAKTGRIA